MICLLLLGGYVVFKSADVKMKAGDKAIFVSPAYTNPSKDSYCVEFWFYMDGADMGTLNVYTNIDNADWKNVFTASGINQEVTH